MPPDDTERSELDAALFSSSEPTPAADAPTDAAREPETDDLASLDAALFGAVEAPTAPEPETPSVDDLAVEHAEPEQPTSSPGASMAAAVAVPVAEDAAPSGPAPGLGAGELDEPAAREAVEALEAVEVDEPDDAVDAEDAAPVAVAEPGLGEAPTDLRHEPHGTTEGLTAAMVDPVVVADDQADSEPPRRLERRRARTFGFAAFVVLVVVGVGGLAYAALGRSGDTSSPANTKVDVKGSAVTRAPLLTTTTSAPVSTTAAPTTTTTEPPTTTLARAPATRPPVTEEPPATEPPATEPPPTEPPVTAPPVTEPPTTPTTAAPSTTIPSP